MKQELTIAMLLLAAGAVLWLWQNDGRVEFAKLLSPRNTVADSDLWSDLTDSDIARLAAGNDDSPKATPSDLQTLDLLQRCAANLRNASPFKCDLELELSLPISKAKLRGEYWQTGQGGRQSRIEFWLPTENGQLSVLKICDGRFLYTQFRTPERSSLEFVDLDRCTQRRKYDRQAEPGNPMRWIASGGLASVFENMAEAFDFAPLVTQKIENSTTATVRGVWNQSQLAKLLQRPFESSSQESEIDWELLPMHLPHAVEIEFIEYSSIGMFPRRIELFRFRSGDQGKTRSSLASILFSPPEVTALAANELLELHTDNGETIDATGQYVNQIIDFKVVRQASKEPNTQTR